MTGESNAMTTKMVRPQCATGQRASLTLWECPNARCTTFGVLVNGPCNSRMRANGECVAVERTYVAVDLDRERLVSEVAATIENRCGVVRGIGPAVREALAAAGLIPTEGGES